MLLIATAARLAARDARPADRPGETTARTREAARAALDRRRLLDVELDRTGPSICREGGMPRSVDDVKRAVGEHEIVAADLARIAGPVCTLDDPADTAEHTAHGNRTADGLTLA